MNPKHIWALFVARNYEFTRDRAGFGWNIMFPFLLVAGFGLLFGSGVKKEFKLGVFPAAGSGSGVEIRHVPERLRDTPLIQLVYFDTREDAMDKLRHHKVDIVVENREAPLRYWVSDSAPKAAIMEKLVRESLVPDSFFQDRLVRSEIPGDQIRYIDWLFPGILAMNIMFSAFFGVGYVIVRYRRNGVLKRLKATPVTAFEYLAAQLSSRVVVLMASSMLVWFGCDLLFSFQVKGALVDAVIVFLAGTICLVSFGLILACRGTNEELTNGIINFLCWPMMFLSEVWFSIEGAADWIRQIAAFLPLTHFLTAARKVINDGATLGQVSHEILLMAGLSLVFLIIGSGLFSWTK